MKKSPLSRIGSAFRDFWEKVGTTFPSLTGAPSTDYYLECEQILFRTLYPNLKGRKVIKTDLWDEAKNSQILKWVADQGAHAYGMDISFPIARDAKALFKTDFSGFVLSDARSVSFADESFDMLYSMGTIEHFPEYRTALKEFHRILKKDGRAIIGIPNKCDPFLRPLMVFILHKLKMYSYGDEKSFSRRQFDRILSESGFRVIGHSGILFIPGLLRMIDLFLYVRWPRTTVLTRPFVRFFSGLYRRYPSLRKHGYLTAFLVEKK